jgi:glycosyltransferase involved in cell wall biosynthesis
MQRLHLVSLPHTRVEDSFCHCAYTSKVLKFCRMMAGDYEIVLYAPDSDINIENVRLWSCLSDATRQEIFGKDNPSRLATWPSIEQSAKFNAGAIAGLLHNLQPHDLILLTGGRTHAQIMAAFPNHLFCEPFCGYEGICTDRVAFESYSHMHKVYALRGIDNGRWFDAVIPNFFDRKEFYETAQTPADPPYLLFLGRVVSRKGPHVAGEIAAKVGMKLVIAGAGAMQKGDDVVAPEITIKNAEYAGAVGVSERAKLLAEATALICPTIYLEPFGGVAVEAMMAGCPVLSTDFGAFPETVRSDVGVRFHSLAEGVAGVKAVALLDRAKIQQYARDHYSLEAVRPMFKAWFDRIGTMWGKGWYEGV